MTQALFFAGLALAAMSQAQTTVAASGPVTARPGQTVNMVFMLTTPTPVAGLQWKIEVPSEIGGPGSAAVGTVAQAAEKTLHRSTDGLICLVVGMNDKVFSSGEIARYTVVIPATAQKGVYQVPVSDPLAADAAGVPVPVVVGSTYEIRILARADIDGDGVVTMEDFRLMLDQVLGRAPCTNDQTGDGKCDLLDVLAVVRASFDKN